MNVSLDGKSEATSDLHDFRKADVSEFGKAEAQVAEAEEAIRIIRIAFGKEPGRCAVGASVRVARTVGSSVRRKRIPWRTAIPRSSMKARIWFMMPVRCDTSRSRTRC